MQTQKPECNRKIQTGAISVHDSHTLQKECFAQATTCESISAAAVAFASRRLQDTRACWKCHRPGIPSLWKRSLSTAVLPLPFACAPVLDLDMKKLVISVSTFSCLGFSPWYLFHTNPNLTCKSPLSPLGLFLFLAHWEGHSQAEKLCPWG